MKKLLSLLLIFAMLLSLAACGSTGTTTDTTEATAQQTVAETTVEAVEETTEETTLPDMYPLSVTDQAGREVTIQAKPERLVSGYYISTSALIALGLQDNLVGIEAKANKRAIYKLAAPELIELPSVGTAKEFDLEGCAALEPDLVILPLKLKNAAQTLEELGIPVLLVNPEDQELLTQMVDLIATATDTKQAAQALLDFTAAQQSFLEEALAEVDQPTVYLAGNSAMLSTAGDAMYQSDMIRLAGGTNVAGEIEDTYWVEVSYEQLLAWDPEYILLASDADYTAEDVLADPNLAACKAVVNGNVYQLPGKAEAWDSPVPSGILGALWLANVLHPEIVTQSDCEERIDEYYETFYHFTYSEN